MPSPASPLDFVYTGHAVRVVFGAGSLDHLEREIGLLGARRALVLSTPEQAGQAEDIARRLGARCAGIFARAVMHVPIETARAAREEAARVGADCALAVGGGSTTGLGKAIALESALPILAIPTTYAGSEMTTIYGISEGGAKKTGRDARVLPRTVIYDPKLTLSLPPALSAVSGMNAIAHSVEALYAVDANPIISLMAEEGIRALARGLPRVVAAPGDLDARADCLYGAWLCGTALNGTSMALHHKLCHTLGGSFNLPHAETHTVILPHATAYNARGTPAAMVRIAAALGAPTAAQGLLDLERRLGTPLALKDIGLSEAALDRAAELAAANPYANPVPIERAAIRRLLDNAYHGRAPEEA
ncbi:MAG: maleylacetate reductase [Burkholderiales bacterium]|nr:maleylacetate reductase [Burkholderiales bacterium]